MVWWFAWSNCFYAELTQRIYENLFLLKYMQTYMIINEIQGCSSIKFYANKRKDD